MRADPVLSVERQESCVILRTALKVMRVSFEDVGIARVIVTLNTEAPNPPATISAGGQVATDGPMLDPARPRKTTRWNLTESAMEIRIASTALTLVVDRVSGAFSWYDAQGSLLTREPELGGKVLERTALYRRTFDEKDVVIKTTVDGVRAVSGEGKPYFLRDAYRAKLSFEFQDGEAIYGLGQHEEGILDYRGKTQYLYQQNMKVALPALVSSRGWGLLVHAYSLMIFRDGELGSYLWVDACDTLDYFFVAGPEFDDIVRGFRFLTGPAALPPRWAFGYVQSKERYKDAAELLAVADEFRERDIPLDCLVLDWQSWPEGLWGQKSFDPARFPDPSAMSAALRDRGVKFMISIWPNMSGEGENRLEMKSRGFMLGNESTYDAFNPDARALYWKQACEGLYSHGVDAWWCDCTEPFEADWSGPVRLEPEARMELNVGAAKKYLDPSQINTYSLLHSEALYEGQRAQADGKRVLNLTRSAYPGQQRYGTVTWSGDVSATWDTLRRELPDALNFCITGLPYWTTDIGAFFVAKKEQWFWDGDYDQGASDLGYRELFVRWLQFGAFLPMMRAHGTDTPREPWRFGEKGEPFYDAILRFIRLRYRLLPYLYSLAGAARFDGYTILRSLAFDFRADPKSLHVADQFMLGPSLLVCPVLRPQLYSPGSTPLKGVPEYRSVYLPDGARWQDFWDGSVHDGGRTIEAPTPLDQIPLFIRSGSILPLGGLVPHSEKQLGIPLKLRVYPGADADFVLYEDAGDGYGHEKGECSRIAFRWIDAERTLVVAAREGAYPGMDASRRFLVRLMVAGLGQDTIEASGNAAGTAAPLELGYSGGELRVVIDG